MISINWEEFKSAHEKLEKARSDLSQLSLSLHRGQTHSQAVDEFLNRTNELVDLIVSYENLLWKDSEKLLNTSELLKEMDEAQAEEYEAYKSSLSSSVYHKN